MEIIGEKAEEGMWKWENGRMRKWEDLEMGERGMGK
jgi:hypothetical protein